VVNIFADSLSVILLCSSCPCFPRLGSCVAKNASMRAACCSKRSSWSWRFCCSAPPAVRQQGSRLVGATLLFSKNLTDPIGASQFSFVITISPAVQYDRNSTPFGGHARHKRRKRA
jgi:hypothetical protein